MNVLDRRSSGATVGMRIKDGSSPSTRSTRQKTLAAVCTVPRYPGRAFSENSSVPPLFIKE